MYANVEPTSKRILFYANSIIGADDTVSLVCNKNQAGSMNSLSSRGKREEGGRDRGLLTSPPG